MAEEAPSSLTFDTPAGPSTAACTFCAQPIERTYFTINGQAACAACRHGVGQTLTERPGVRGWLTAIALGSAAGLAGAVVWWAIRHFASLEIGLIAIAIGHTVGLGVRRGSGGRGGRAFQVLAVLLTYFWTTANYAPDIVQGLVNAAKERGEQAAAVTPGTTAPAPQPPARAPEVSPAAAQAAPAGAGEGVVLILTGAVMFAIVVFGLCMASPFLLGVENVIGLLIISFGLYQAWQLNAAGQVAIEGPFRLDAGARPQPSA